MTGNAGHFELSLVDIKSKRATMDCGPFALVAEAELAAQRADLKHKDHAFAWPLLVAGAGLEPATFGL